MANAPSSGTGWRESSGDLPFGKSEILPDGLLCRIPSGRLKGTGVIARLDRATSIPETPKIEPRSRGVLGRPVKPGDDNGVCFIHQGPPQGRHQPRNGGLPFFANPITALRYTMGIASLQPCYGFMPEFR